MEDSEDDSDQSNSGEYIKKANQQPFGVEENKGQINEGQIQSKNKIQSQSILNPKT